MWPTLRSRRQFDLVYTQGTKLASDSLVLFLLADAPGDPHVAYVASRKVGGAVDRNRAKRLLRAAFRELVDGPNPPRGWLVLVARRAILELKSHEVAVELRALLEDSSRNRDEHTA
jgi:ribonuclease P protein component